MSAPFCTGCGATVAAGTRFCVKCGQPVGQAAPPPPPAGFPTVSPQVPAPPPPPPQTPLPPRSAQFPAAPPAKQGAGAGVWIGLFGVLLLLGGAGLWFYTTHMQGSKEAQPVQVAATQPVPAPAPSTTPETPPPNPDFAKPEVPPPNPDFAKKDQVPAPATDKAVRGSNTNRKPVNPVAAPPPQPAEPASPAPRPAVKTAAPTTGTLHATVEVAQNGEVVFENLPAGRMRFIYDHSAWQPTIHRQANGTQTLIMRSLKAGIQRSCDVQWEIVQ
jgi:hypothetical protein